MSSEMPDINLPLEQQVADLLVQRIHYRDALREARDMAIAALPYTPDHIPRSAFNSIITTINALLGEK